MGYQYGIQQVRETFLKLCLTYTRYEGLQGAYFEINVIEEDDVTPEHYKKIEKWKADYLTRNTAFVNKDGNFESPDNQNVNKLTEQLVWLLLEICETNAKLSINTEDQ